MTFTTDEIKKLWEGNESRQRACSNYLGEINSNYTKSDRINLIKRITWILICIVCDIPITGAHTDTNKSGRAGNTSEYLSKVGQSPYNSV